MKPLWINSSSVGSPGTINPAYPDRYIAQLANAGHDIPEADLNPMMNKRRWD